MNLNDQQENLMRERRAKALKALRAFAGISAHELSRRTGIPPGTMKSLELANRPLSPIYAALISAETGVHAGRLTIGELFEWDGKTPYGVESMERWYQQGKCLSPTRVKSQLRALHQRADGEAAELSSEAYSIFFSYAAACYETNHGVGAFTNALKDFPLGKKCL